MRMTLTLHLHRPIIGGSEGSEGSKDYTRDLGRFSLLPDLLHIFVAFTLSDKPFQAWQQVGDLFWDVQPHRICIRLLFVFTAWNLISDDKLYDRWINNFDTDGKLLQHIWHERINLKDEVERAETWSKDTVICWRGKTGQTSVVLQMLKANRKDVMRKARGISCLTRDSPVTLGGQSREKLHIYTVVYVQTNRGFTGTYWLYCTFTVKDKLPPSLWSTNIKVYLRWSQ